MLDGQTELITPSSRGSDSSPGFQTTVVLGARGIPVSASGEASGDRSALLALHLPVSDASRLPVPYKFEDIAERARGPPPRSATRRSILSGRPVRKRCHRLRDGQATRRPGTASAVSRLVRRPESRLLRGLFPREPSGSWHRGNSNINCEISAKVDCWEFPRFIRDRIIGARLRARVRYWRIYCGLHLRVSEKRLQDLETIIHPTSFAYRPQPYPGGSSFFNPATGPAAATGTFMQAGTTCALSGSSQDFRAATKPCFMRRTLTWSRTCCRTACLKPGEMGGNRRAGFLNGEGNFQNRSASLSRGYLRGPCTGFRAGIPIRIANQER